MRRQASCGEARVFPLVDYLIPSLLYLFYGRGISPRRRRRGNSSGTRNRERFEIPAGSGCKRDVEKGPRKGEKDDEEEADRTRWGGERNVRLALVVKERRYPGVSHRKTFAKADGEIAHLDSTRENE